jgi:murein DD-endopeptidase MepM/ murein hydrolase activator NlpD
VPPLLRRLLEGAVALGALTLTACGAAPVLARSEPPRAEERGLEITGTARIKELSALGMERFDIELLLKNQGGPRRLTRAEILLASEGGWSFALGDPLEKRGSLFGLGPDVRAQAERHASLTYWWSAPIVAFLLRVEAIDEAGAPEARLVQIPVERPGFAKPAALPLTDAGFLALQGPIEIVPLSNGKRWISLVGQVANVTGRPLTVTRFRLTARGEGGKGILDTDLRSAFPIKHNAATVVPFLYGFEVPGEVKAGVLTLDAGLAIEGGEGERSLGRSVPFAAAEPLRVSSPIRGTWIWRNGPGEPVLNVHTPWPEQRYAYDLSVLRDVGGRRVSFEGDAQQNESFFAWDQPVLAAAAGTVVEVVDDVTDNRGRTPALSSLPRRNARIVLRHGADRFTAYIHVRKGSAVVKVGQEVQAGEVLARVGNAGFSTEPHLHFAAFKIDATGRVQAVPMEIDKLRTASGEEVSGVPMGGALYVSE